MPLYVKDDTTAHLVAELAKLRGVSKQEAVRMAVKAELDRAAEALLCALGLEDHRRTLPQLDVFRSRRPHLRPPLSGDRQRQNAVHRRRFRED